MKKLKLDSRFLYMLIPMLLFEAMFHWIQFGFFDFWTFLRIFFYSLSLSILIWFICSRFRSKKVYYIFGILYFLWFACYGFAELVFKNFMGDFYSFGTVGDGAARIAQYVTIFISAGKLKYYLCFLPLIVYLLLHHFVRFNGKGPFQLPLIIGISAFLLMLPCMNLGSGVNSILEVYATFSNKSVIIDKCGLQHFLFRDLTAFVYKKPEAIIIEEPDDEEEPVVQIKTRKIDDTQWKAIMEAETDEGMKTIDNYLMSKRITQPNEMTGKFKGYNFIYFMVEAGDYLELDPELTPTLYKMYSDGYTFYNHYTPVYSCATGESEFVSYTSIFPYLNTCTPNYVAGIDFYQALPYLFKDAGYSTFALHNWRDEFYERKIILPSVGFDSYTDIDDIWQDTSIQHTNGWQSDTMLIEQAIKQIDATQGNFFCDIITSVMHFPYEESSYWGDYYLDEINEVHPDWGIDYKRYMSKCMDFDNGMKVLLDYLDSAGLADNTVICIYCDHRPYWMDYDKVMEMTRWINPDRAGEYGIYRSPFIIYNKASKGYVNNNYCSTPDHVPTIANLFDLNYDPRLYAGSDAFAGSNTVIMADGNWLNEYGSYDATTEKFTPNGNVTLPSDDYVSRTNTNVQNTIRISYMILDEDYFQNRRAICIPH